MTGAYWAIWLEYGVDWEILASHNVSRQSRSMILQFIRTTNIDGWLKGTLAGKRIRSRENRARVPGSKLYIFPDQMTQRVIMIGADQLPGFASRFWRVVALGASGGKLVSTAPPVYSIPDLGIPYYLPEVLDRVLEMVLKSATAKLGWLAVRSGDFFEIKAISNTEAALGERISIEANPLLREIINSRQIHHVDKKDMEWAMVPRSGQGKSAHFWAGIPLVIGQRLIGLIALWRDAPPAHQDWEGLEELVKRMAPYVEASITFSDLTEHLGRMALLNDFAVTITSALEPEQIAQRMFALMKRAFGTERINIVVLSPDGNGLQNYTSRDGSIILQTIASDDPAIPEFMGTGEIYRVDSILPDSKFTPIYSGSRSALIIPIKYRRQLIGKMGLESTEEAAFRIYDEHLLVVISSHLAGLLENGRLRREAESKARNLSLIHEVIEQVIGLTDLREVSQIAAELMARNFAYEMVVIARIEGDERDITVTGIGGSAADLVQQGLTYMDESRKDGIVMRVAVTGQNIIVNDVAESPFYRPIPNWDAGAEMCVALKEGDTTIGVIDVESQRKNAFSQNDLLVLESLAGILSSVMTSAGQYQKLQATVDQLRAARQELQERIVTQRMTESRLVQAAKLAAVGEMAAGIAHELNNPLTTVTGFTELVLEEMPEDGGVKDDLELVLREAQRARGVVRRLLDFARQSESSRVRSDLNEIVVDVLALVNHLLRTSGIQLSTDLAESLPWVSVDRNQIKQVLLNLVHNALHAMPTGGELCIISGLQKRDQREWLTVSLADTGTGIAPENLERIFEPFFTTRSKDGGTGLGLSVTYGIVTDHGGFIDVESQVGKGSKFTVWLPVEVD